MISWGMNGEIEGGVVVSPYFIAIDILVDVPDMKGFYRYCGDLESSYVRLALSISVSSGLTYQRIIPWVNL